MEIVRKRIIALPFRRGAIDEESPSYPTSTKITLSPSGTPSNAQPGLSRVSSEESPDGGEIQEIRKDSALYLEEAEGSNLRKILRSRPPGIFRKARRESSGYATSVGSFDEERKGSISSAGEPDALLKEKRRPIPKAAGGKAEESAGEKPPTGAPERMPTTELHRKVSSAGLDMPDIEEAKEIPREDASPRREGRDGDAETTGAGKRIASLSVIRYHHPRCGDIRYRCNGDPSNGF